MFRCSSASLIGGVNATFSVQFNTQPGENVYVVGNARELGEWDVSKAKKMTWNCGNTWDVEIGFPDIARLQYKYFVQVEEAKTIHWENISNRDIVVKEDGSVIEDEWDEAGNAMQ